MKVENITSNNGNKIANQFIITDNIGNKYFQSYSSVIVKKTNPYYQPQTIELDKKYWNYSNTTGKYRNIFLGETIKDTKAKIKNGTYILTDLNKQRGIMENITVNGINLFEFSMEELENIKDTVQHMIDEKYAEENSESEE